MTKSKQSSAYDEIASSTLGLGSVQVAVVQTLVMSNS